jgi:uncharacterized membrane protein YhhN
MSKFMLIKKYWIWLFLAVLAADVIVLAIPQTNTHVFLKILLMPLLMAGLLAEKKDKHEKNWRVILAGLLLAWAGDTLLLFSADDNQFFILGLVCFLGTHIAYIIYFFRYNKWSRQWFYRHPILSFLVILYAVAYLGFLMPSLHHLMYPVAAYTLVISIMLLQALSAQPFIPPACNKLFIPGAICFIISDSLLAWDKFSQHFPFADSLIIATYGVAQLLIVRGAALNTDKKLDPAI